MVHVCVCGGGAGGDVGAREARLSIMIGGDATAVTNVMPLFDVMVGTQWAVHTVGGTQWALPWLGG